MSKLTIDAKLIADLKALNLIGDDAMKACEIYSRRGRWQSKQELMDLGLSERGAIKAIDVLLAATRPRKGRPIDEAVEAAIKADAELAREQKAACTKRPGSWPSIKVEAKIDELERRALKMRRDIQRLSDGLRRLSNELTMPAPGSDELSELDGREPSGFKFGDPNRPDEAIDVSLADIAELQKAGVKIGLPVAKRSRTEGQLDHLAAKVHAMHESLTKLAKDHHADCAGSAAIKSDLRRIDFKVDKLNEARDHDRNAEAICKELESIKRQQLVSDRADAKAAGELVVTLANVEAKLASLLERS